MSTTTATRLGPIGQIALTVQDLARATGFYRDALGLPLLFEVPGMSFLDANGVRLMLATTENGGAAANGSTVLYYRVEDIQEAHAQLTARGVAFVRDPHLLARMPDHDLWMAFFNDGEGNLLALMSEVTR
jgi:methylmalonyl-CoA/ethylmalonyl-CoA epimerase